jgi:hypothetical protein
VLDKHGNIMVLMTHTPTSATRSSVKPTTRSTSTRCQCRVTPSASTRCSTR